MSVLFSQTMRSVRAHSPFYVIFGKVLIMLVLSAWFYWFFFAQIKLFEITSDARIHVSQPLYQVETSRKGKVVQSFVKLGAKVSKGDVLLALDSEPEELQQKEILAELKFLNNQITSLNEEIELQVKTLESASKEANLKVGEGRSRLAESKANMDVAVEETQRLEELYNKGLLPELDYKKSAGKAQAQEHATAFWENSVARLRESSKLDAGERKVQVTRLLRLKADMEGRRGMLEARNQRLQHLIDSAKVLAPANGTLAEVPDLPEGTFLDEGERVVTILPDGEMKIVAMFAPRQALGRIRKDQTAQLKLDGFPWTQFGSLTAVVNRVGMEPSDGRVRVELDLITHKIGGNIPIEHGLPGSLEVEVDELSPAALVLQLLGRKRAS